MDSILDKIFLPPLYLKAIFIKKLAPNDDSGRHGVVIPVEAYPMFPVPPDFDPSKNFTVDITTLYFVKNEVSRCDSKIKHYERYPERRLTRLPDFINDRAAESLIVIGQTEENEYEIHLFEPSDSEYKAIVKEFTLQVKEKTAYYVGLNLAPKGLKRTKNLELVSSGSVERFLIKFDAIKASGPHKTLRSGDTGIGYTFETIMGLKENNFSGPDFEDIEIKCYTQKNALTKKNLFLKEPEWCDDLGSMVERVKIYGYLNEEKRQALYSSVTIKRSSHSFNFHVSRSDKRVYLRFENRNIGFWDFKTLQDRLDEKLSKAMYIGTNKTIKNKTEYFDYNEVTFCSEPFIDSFINLIEVGQIILELRMHINEAGSIRNHGTGFRINEKYLPDLYATIQKLRT